MTKMSDARRDTLGWKILLNAERGEEIRCGKGKHCSNKNCNNWLSVGKKVFTLTTKQIYRIKFSFCSEQCRIDHINDHGIMS